MLNFTVHNREELIAQMSANRTDLAVMVRPPADPSLVSEAFAPHPYVIVSAPGHPLAAERSIAMERLLQEPFVVREKGSDTWQSMVLDVRGFPLQLHWYVVHRRGKRLPPVAQAFKDFLLVESAALIAAMMPYPPSSDDAR